jgi:hypothetical protein
MYIASALSNGVIVGKLDGKVAIPVAGPVEEISAVHIPHGGGRISALVTLALAVDAVARMGHQFRELSSA